MLQLREPDVAGLLPEAEDDAVLGDGGTERSKLCHGNVESSVKVVNAERFPNRMLGGRVQSLGPDTGATCKIEIRR